MKKLFELREWLTVVEAAQQLSAVLQDGVTEADILRLALDGHLQLSVYFVNQTHGKCGRVVPLEQAKCYELPAIFGGEPRLTLRGLEMREGEVLEFDTKEGDDGEEESIVSTLDGIWDLPMLGGETLDIEHRYQQLTNGPEVTLQAIDGAFVDRPDGRVCQLQVSYDDNEFQDGSLAQAEKLRQQIADQKIDRTAAKKLLDRHKQARTKFLEEQRAKPDAERYHPAGGLPNDAVLVVRCTALIEFQSRFTSKEKQKDRPLGARERTTLLTLIAALARELKIDTSRRSKAAGQLAKLTDQAGAPVSARAIEDHLKRIPDALDRRSKT